MNTKTQTEKAETQPENRAHPHTPGRWEVIKHGRAPLDSITIRRDYTSGEYIAQIVPTGSDDALTVQANARLIAASPDLLAACKRMAQAIGDLEGTEVEYPRAIALAWAASEGRAAIAKAEKEQP